MNAEVISAPFEEGRPLTALRQMPRPFICFSG
jgi:hypothetical protein